MKFYTRETNKCLHKIYTNFKNCDIVQEDFVPYHSFLLWRRGKCTHLCGAFDDR